MFNGCRAENFATYLGGKSKQQVCTHSPRPQSVSGSCNIFTSLYRNKHGIQTVMISSEYIISLMFTPHAVTGTTGLMTFLVGNACKPLSFVGGTSKISLIWCDVFSGDPSSSAPDSEMTCEGSLRQSLVDNLSGPYVIFKVNYAYIIRYKHQMHTELYDTCFPSHQKISKSPLHNFWDIVVI